VLRACDRLAGLGPAAVGRLAAGEEAEAGDEEDPASEAEVSPSPAPWPLRTPNRRTFSTLPPRGSILDVTTGSSTHSSIINWSIISFLNIGPGAAGAGPAGGGGGPRASRGGVPRPVQQAARPQVPSTPPPLDPCDCSTQVERITILSTCVTGTVVRPCP
jgi:hypothetical protein